MSKFLVGNLFLGSSLLLQAASQIILKNLMSELDENAGVVQKLRQLLVASRFWRTGLVGVMVVAGFLCWVACLSKLDLSYAYPVACGSAVVVVLLSVIFLGEAVSPRMWLGTVLIMAGTMLLAPNR